MKFSILLSLSILFGCTSKEDRIIKGAGATFPISIYSSWAYEYKKHTEIALNYRSIGSSGGVKHIKGRLVEFGASDAPIEPNMLKQDKLLQFPAIIGGVVPIVNIPNIMDGSLRLDGIVLSQIFTGEIEYWDDALIVKDNPNLQLPHEKIKVVQRSDGSGTTAIFTKYLSSVNSEFKSRVGVGKTVTWPSGYQVRGNQGVAKLIKQMQFSIGYVEYSYAKKSNLNFTQIRNKDGYFVSPRVDTFRSAAQYAKWDQKNHFYLWMVNSPGRTSWPITGASFIILAKENSRANNKVIEFFDWCFEYGDDKAIAKTYIPLPNSLKQEIREYWKNNL